MIELGSVFGGCLGRQAVASHLYEEPLDFLLILKEGHLRRRIDTCLSLEELEGLLVDLRCHDADVIDVLRGRSKALHLLDGLATHVGGSAAKRFELV